MACNGSARATCSRRGLPLPSLPRLEQMPQAGRHLLMRWLRPLRGIHEDTGAAGAGIETGAQARLADDNIIARIADAANVAKLRGHTAIVSRRCLTVHPVPGPQPTCIKSAWTNRRGLTLRADGEHSMLRNEGELAILIKTLREERGWSQAQLAARAGVSQQLVNKLESGKARETRKIVAIAKAFDLSVEDFVGARKVEPRERTGTASVGQRLRDRRRELKMTTAEVAKAAGVTQGAVSHWENGLMRLSWPSVMSVAAALKMAPGALAFGTDDVAPLPAIDVQRLTAAIELLERLPKRIRSALSARQQAKLIAHAYQSGDQAMADSEFEALALLIMD